ncbi:MAG: hypothetical protein ACK4PK_00770 [Alphaproteobacteria bacterium]
MSRNDKIKARQEQRKTLASHLSELADDLVALPDVAKAFNQSAHIQEKKRLEALQEDIQKLQLQMREGGLSSHEKKAYEFIATTYMIERAELCVNLALKTAPLVAHPVLLSWRKSFLDEKNSRRLFDERVQNNYAPQISQIILGKKPFYKP